MSIIHEALKKASRRREGLYRLIENEPAGERLHIERPDKVKRYAVVIIIALVALNVSIFAWNFTLKSEINRIARSVLGPGTAGEGAQVNELSAEASSRTLETAALQKAEMKIAPVKAVVEEEAVAMDTGLPELVLKGTMLSKTTSRAFINESMVKVGEEIEGAEVLNIDGNSVTLRMGEREFTIYK
jgi:hypothetical protein